MDLVDQLFHRLEEAVARDGSGDGLTVAHLYQRLIPYRAVRADLGLLELAPYENALLRLLSGERGYLRLEDERAREVIVRELASPNPILGIYRDYAGLRVGLGEEELPPLVPSAPHSPLEVSASLRIRELSEIVRPPAAACRTCRAPLPAGPEVRFCPACGADQTMEPCATCGTQLKEEWNFCIRCGQRRER
jgi:hypothetical protein